MTPSHEQPSSRYTTFVEKLLAFYDPRTAFQHLRNDFLRVLKPCHTIIMEEYTSDRDDVVQMVAGQMLSQWKQKKMRPDWYKAQGTTVLEVIEDIHAFATYYYDTIFLEMAQGDRARLQHTFPHLLGCCVVVYEDLWAMRHKDHSPVE